MTSAKAIATRVAVVAESASLRDYRFDGLVNRHVDWVSRLGADPGLDVSLIRLTRPGSDHPIDGRLAHLKQVRVAWADLEGGRRARLLRPLQAAKSARHPRELALEAALASVGADAALTIGPWMQQEYRPVFTRIPTLHLFEEDVSRLPGLATQSLQGRLMRRYEAAAQWLSPGQPARVVVISEREVAAARKKFRAPVVVVPYWLSSEEWTRRPHTGEGDHVLVIGALDQARNATGLAQVFEQLQRRVHDLDVRLVSDGGLHPVLHPWLSQPWVRQVESQYPSSDNYRHARLAIVPALRATGIKTTILQAWQCGVPVAAYQESANTLGSNGADICSAATTSEELAELVLRLWNDEVARADQVALGQQLLDASFDQDKNWAAMRACLSEVLRRPVVQEQVT